MYQKTKLTFFSLYLLGWIRLNHKPKLCIGLMDWLILAWNQGLWGSEIHGACLICNFYIHAPLNFQLCTFFNQISNFTLCYCYRWARTLPKVCPTLSTWLWQYLPFSLAQGNILNSKTLGFFFFLFFHRDFPYQIGSKKSNTPW